MCSQILLVINYLNDAEALTRGENILRAVRWEWYQYQLLYPGTPNVVAAWDQWYLDLMQTRLIEARTFLVAWATEGVTHYQGINTPDAQYGLLNSQNYLRLGQGLGGFNDLGYPTGTPTPP